MASRNRNGFFRRNAIESCFLCAGPLHGLVDHRTKDIAQASAFRGFVKTLADAHEVYMTLFPADNGGGQRFTARFTDEESGVSLDRLQVIGPNGTDLTLSIDEFRMAWHEDSIDAFLEPNPPITGGRQGRATREADKLILLILPSFEPPC